MKNLKIISLLIIVFAIQSLSAQEHQKFYFNKTVKGSFEDVTSKVKSLLKEQGFGVITEIDMDVTLKEKLQDVEMKPYKILGVCNPSFAYQTLQIEENIGLFLPCKVLVKEMGNGSIEVVMVNPSALMKMLGNTELEKIAQKVTDKFLIALENL
nr:DUF302 domain-containing protein [Bacteroidota bacterium]